MFTIKYKYISSVEKRGVYIHTFIAEDGTCVSMATVSVIICPLGEYTLGDIYEALKSSGKD